MPKRPDAWEAAEQVPSPLELATMNNFVKTGYDLSKIKDCALEAGASPLAAGAVSARAIKKMGNNPLMQKALKKAGVDFERLAEKISDLLDVENPAFPGKPDGNIQLKAVDKALQIMEALPNPRLEIDQRQEIININITAELVRSIESVTGQRVIDVEPEPDTEPKGYFEEESTG